MTTRTDVDVPPAEESAEISAEIDEQDEICEECGLRHIFGDPAMLLKHSHDPAVLEIFRALPIDHDYYVCVMGPFWTHTPNEGQACTHHGMPCDHSIETEIIRDVIRDHGYGGDNAPMRIGRMSDAAQCLMGQLEEHVMAEYPWRLWCEFDLATWANEVNQNLEEYAEASGNHEAPITRPMWRAGLAELVYSRIVLFDPQPGAPDRGRMQWNMAFDEWLPLRDDYRSPSPGFLRSFAPALDAQALSRMVKRLIDSGKLAAHVGRRLPMREWLAVRDLVFERDDYTCVFCGTRGGKLHCDHLIPLSRGGSNDPDNLTTACDVCSLSKHAKTPEEWLGW